jgi:hypothetical protein
MRPAISPAAALIGQAGDNILEMAHQRVFWARSEAITPVLVGKADCS